MSDTWINLSDDVSLSSSDQIRVSMSFRCTPFASIDKSQLQSFIGADPDVISVLDVSEGWTDTVTSVITFECNYQVTLNPQNGVKAGDIRSAVNQAIQKANDQNVIKSDQVVVGAIEKKGTAAQSLLSSITSPPSTSTTISLAAVAIIAVVALLIFWKASEIV